jgi:hypothetical protein
MVVFRDGGSSKFGTTPGGGVPAGQLGSITMEAIV